MELQKLIHRLRYENSSIGEVTREIENDKQYYSYRDESKLKVYLNRKLLKMGMLNEFVELLWLHETINLLRE